MPIQLKKVRKTIGGVIDGSEYYVSAINDETISTEDLCHYVNDTCTLSPADVVAFLEAYKNLFSKEIAHGNKLELAGIGTFIPIFGGKGGYNDTNPFRKKDLVLKRIRFVINRKLKKQIERSVILDPKKPIDRNCPYSKEVRQERILKKLRSAAFLLSKEVAELNRCSRVTAWLDLNALCRKELIRKKVFGGTAHYYGVNENEQDTIVQTE